MSGPAGSFLLGKLIAFVVAMALCGKDVREGKVDTIFIMLLSAAGGVLSLLLDWLFS